MFGADSYWKCQRYYERLAGTSELKQQTKQTFKMSQCTTLTANTQTPVSLSGLLSLKLKQKCKSKMQICKGFDESVSDVSQWCLNT